MHSGDWTRLYCKTVLLEGRVRPYDPRLFVGIGVIPIHDVNWAVEESNRILGRGIKGPMVDCQALEGCPPYRDPIYDRFRARDEEAGVYLTLHILTGRVIDALSLAQMGQFQEETSADPRLWVDLFIEIQTIPANDFICGGTLGFLQPEIALQRI